MAQVPQVCVPVGLFCMLCAIVDQGQLQFLIVLLI